MKPGYNRGTKEGKKRGFFENKHSIYSIKHKIYDESKDSYSRETRARNKN